MAVVAAFPQPVMRSVLNPCAQCIRAWLQSVRETAGSVSGHAFRRLQACPRVYTFSSPKGAAYPSPGQRRCEKIAALPPAVRKGSALSDRRLKIKLFELSRLPESRRLSLEFVHFGQEVKYQLTTVLARLRERGTAKRWVRDPLVLHEENNPSSPGFAGTLSPWRGPFIDFRPPVNPNVQTRRHG